LINNFFSTFDNLDYRLSISIVNGASTMDSVAVSGEHSTMRATELAARLKPTLAIDEQRRLKSRKPLEIMLSMCDGKRSDNDVHQAHSVP